MDAGQAQRELIPARSRRLTVGIISTSGSGPLDQLTPVLSGD